jgi:hypothetical protein
MLTFAIAALLNDVTIALTFQKFGEDKVFKLLCISFWPSISFGTQHLQSSRCVEGKRL